MKASIIVPLYNEEARVKPFLRQLKKNIEVNWEIIFVNDGSIDNTLHVLKNFQIKNKRIISYNKNRGKGFAVKKGVLAANGDFILFIDADGSIHPSQIKSMLRYLKKYDVVVGTRASKQSQVSQSFIRLLTGVTFNIYVNLLYHTNIYDNLCGFKGFKRKIAKELFANLLSDRWIFDVELFFKIKKRALNLYQMPIKWEHKSDSKMKFTDIIRISVELIILRLKLLYWK